MSLASCWLQLANMYQTRMFSRKFAKNAFKRWGSLSRPWSWSRNVSTWSPLGTAFNTKPEQRLNLSFDREWRRTFRDTAAERLHWVLLAAGRCVQCDRGIGSGGDRRRSHAQDSRSVRPAVGHPVSGGGYG